MIPDTIAMIIAVSTDAMILFHSKDDIIGLLRVLPGGGNRARHRRQQIGFLPSTQTDYRASRGRANRACCRAMPSAPVNPILMIPARLAATRLPGKPLAEIAGVPMIVHVWRRAIAA